jgi:adenylate kinase family enzyme
MTRVAVIGNAGGGKTTLCAILGRRLKIPVHTIDRVQWKPGWVAADPAEVATAQAAWLAQGSWIIDGFGGWELIVQRFAAADTIIFVDLPLYVHYWWAFKRQIKSIVQPRRDLPPDCPMLPMTKRLLQVMWYVHIQLRPQIIAQLMAQRPHTQIIHLRSPKAIRAFLATV